jgi:hypothetical protein
MGNLRRHFLFGKKVTRSMADFAWRGEVWRRIIEELAAMVSV